MGRVDQALTGTGYALAFGGGIALVCAAVAVNAGTLRFGYYFRPLDLHGLAVVWHEATIFFLAILGIAVVRSLWQLIEKRQDDRNQIKYLQEQLRGLLTGELVDTNPETGCVVRMHPFVRDDAGGPRPGK